MRTADLTGALLDLWTARAEGVPADELEIRPAVRPGDPRSPDEFCVRHIGHLALLRIDYSTNWAMTGPLLFKYHMTFETNMADKVSICVFDGKKIQWEQFSGKDPLIAICRAVVRAAFGDEVEDLPC